MKTLEQLLGESEVGKHLALLEKYYADWYLEAVEYYIDKELEGTSYEVLTSPIPLIYIDIPTSITEKLRDSVPSPKEFYERHPSFSYTQFDYAQQYRLTPSSKEMVHPLKRFLCDHPLTSFSVSNPETYVYLINSMVSVKDMADDIRSRITKLMWKYKENRVPIACYRAVTEDDEDGTYSSWIDKK